MVITTEPIWNALIRTHHITSRKKIARLRSAAHTASVFALLRSGGAPGLMYVEGREDGVRSWVDCVHRLRYKDYHLAAKPGLRILDTAGLLGMKDGAGTRGVLVEVDSVKEFSSKMAEMGVLEWWRGVMGFGGDRLS